jgi:dTDP-4-amino-4,6-dideoxygalactose transaminase
MKVPYNDMSRIHRDLKPALHDIIDVVTDESAFVDDRKGFGIEFERYTGSDFCVTCANGTDALYLAIKSLQLKPGSRIAVPAVSYAATAMAVVNAQCVPLFIDVVESTGLMDLDELEKEKENFNCVIPVHLFGQCIDVNRILKMGTPVIEDCAQAVGARIDGSHVGTFGTIGCFSFYPGKNLGAFGDAGCCITNDQNLASLMKQYASLGATPSNRYDHRTDGINSRMDCIQGMILKEKLKYLDKWTEERVRIGKKYEASMGFPLRSQIGTDVYHVMYALVENRESFINYMKDNGIETNIHYPIALPNLNCFENYYKSCPNANRFCSNCVSLPLFPGMTEEEIDYIRDVYKES